MSKEVKENQVSEPCCKESRHTNTFSALLLISLGIILLLNNFGVLPWGLWETLWKFWPIFLVVWGIETIFGHGLIGGTISSAIGIAILLAVLAYSISLVNTNFDHWMQKQIPSWSEIKKQVPGNQTKQREKVFKCDPITQDCQILYR